MFNIHFLSWDVGSLEEGLGLSCSPCVANIVDWLVLQADRVLEMFLVSSTRQLSKSRPWALTHVHAMTGSPLAGHPFCWVGSGRGSVVQPLRQWLSDHGGFLITAEPWQLTSVVWFGELVAPEAQSRTCFYSAARFCNLYFSVQISESGVCSLPLTIDPYRTHLPDLKWCLVHSWCSM